MVVFEASVIGSKVHGSKDNFSITLPKEIIPWSTKVYGHLNLMNNEVRTCHE